MALLVLLIPLGPACAYWENQTTAQPVSDHVVRSPRPLDLFVPPASPLDDLIAAWKIQESRRLRALRDEYPTPDFYTGRYDPRTMRDWQRSVLRQQGDAIFSAAGDAALKRCLELPFCQSRFVQVAGSLASALLNGVHYRTPFGPFEARLDTPPGVKAEMRRVRVSLEYRVVF